MQEDRVDAMVTQCKVRDCRIVVVIQVAVKVCCKQFCQATPDYADYRKKNFKDAGSSYV